MSIEGETFEGLPVKICPPGRRSKDVAFREPAPGGAIAMTTATSLKWPERPSIVPINRSPVNSATEADKRIRDAERAYAIGVVLRQPHRAGSDDPRMGFPLGRLCATAWANDPDRANAAHAAGASYAKDIRNVAVARGFHVPGSGTDGVHNVESDDNPAPAEIDAARAARIGLERVLAMADEVLREVMPRCPVAMVRLCYDNADPAPNDTSMLINGLWRLAVHYRHFDVNKYRS